MKLITIAFMLICMNSFAQAVKPVITNDLLKEKDAVKAKFFPMSNNTYLYKMHSMPPDTFIQKLNDFRNYFEKQINEEHDETQKELETKDLEYYCRIIVYHDYIPGYGSDSIKTADFARFRTSAVGAANYKHLIDSAYKTTIIKTFSPEEKEKLAKICWDNADLDNTELFKHSLAYRNWLSDYYWFRVRAVKYAALPGRGGYLGDPLGMLTVINNEIKSAFIREYYASRMVSSVIKQEKDNNVKEKVYRDFIAVVTDPYYKAQVTQVYDNFKNMVTNAMAPDFTYTDINNKQVSLKDLRGKYIYIDIWATWCSPCKAEIPYFTKIEQDYQGKNIQFVSLSVDRMADKPKWAAYVNDHHLQGIQLMADKDFSSDFIKKLNVNSIPKYIIIDPAGHIVSGDAKRPSDPELRNQLDVLLAQTSLANNLKTDTTITYYSRLANSKNAADKVKLEQSLYQLLNSSDERNWAIAGRYFLRINAATADSVIRAEKSKFPIGIAVRDERAKYIYGEHEAAKKESLYKIWIKDFPPEKFGFDQNGYDYIRTSIAVEFAKSDNVPKALEYANMVEVNWYKGIAWAATASELLKHEHLAEALLLFKKASSHAYEYLTTRKMDQNAVNAAQGFVSYSNSVAEIFFKQKKYTEALIYAKQARDSSQNEIGNQNPYYVKTLMALGRNKEAFNEIDATVKRGKATVEIKEALKTLYIKVKGNKTGYNQYITSINKILANKKRSEIETQMIDLPAPDFTLKDVDGNTVSLSELRGKIVIVDFWAIWCVPCKASFPSMRLAVNKYRNDPDVRFLFVHTWENKHDSILKTDNNPTTTAKRYVENNKYPFEVLMDLKDPLTGKNTVVSSYHVNAIPTKFVIDKKGNIRFRFTGLADGDDAAAEEVSAMIDLTKNAR